MIAFFPSPELNNSAGYQRLGVLMKAVSLLQGKKLRFSHSQSKHRLFVGNIPKAWDKDELEKVLAEQGPGIQSVELLKVEQSVLGLEHGCCRIRVGYVITMA